MSDFTRDETIDNLKKELVAANEYIKKLEGVIRELRANDQEVRMEDMTSSQSEKDIYNGCIYLMRRLLHQVYEWLEIIGFDISGLDNDEQFATSFYTTEIVEHLFLWNTAHSGGTSQRMKLKELDINDDAVMFDFSEELTDD